MDRAYLQRMDDLLIRGWTVINGSDLKCQNCGNCCTAYETINLNVSDIFNISAYLDISPEAFFDGYCMRIEDGKGGSTFTLDVKGGCRFRRDGKCSIYPVRPDTCALHPFDFPGINISHLAKAELPDNGYTACFIRRMPDGLIIVPDLERMVNSLILAMVKEIYLAGTSDSFDEAAARKSHETGLAQVGNPRVREMMHKKLMYEMIRNAPVDPETNEPALTADEIRKIYEYIRERKKTIG